MNANDFQPLSSWGQTVSFRRDDRNTGAPAETATVKVGEVVREGGAGRNFAVKILNGEPSGTSISTTLLGIVRAESTETATADGRVEVTTATPGSIWRGKGTTAANFNTDALLLGLLNDVVNFDVASGAITIDEDVGSDQMAFCLKIVDGDTARGTLDVAVSLPYTMYGSQAGHSNTGNG